MTKRTYAQRPAPGLDRRVAAAYLGMCARSLDARLAAATGPRCFRIGYAVRYWPAELDRYLEALPVQQEIARRMREVCVYSFDAHLELVPQPEVVLAVPHAAQCLGVCERTLAYWHESGHGPAREVFNGRVWYRGAVIRKYLSFEEQQLGL